MHRIDRFTCEEAFRRLEDYVDRELSPEDMRLIEAHLHDCVRCAMEFQFESALLKDVRTKLKRIDVPQDFRQRIAQLLEEERRRES